MTRTLFRPTALLALAALVACGDKGGDEDDDTGATGEVDEDGDGFTADEDCDDSDEAINPDAAEICDGIDNDCDDLVDDDDDSVDVSGGGTWYGDADEDGYGAPDQTIQACSQPPGTAETGDDCDDDEAAVNPGATEVCNGIDDDCDTLVDDDDDSTDLSTGTTGYPDTDGDGYGDAAEAGIDACDLPSGSVADNTDCDDTNADINPGAAEVCDDADVDEDCSGASDDLDPGVDTATQTTWFVDSDGDGYGDASDGGALYCDEPSGVSLDNTDCNDDEAGVNPGATEVCDDADVDEDCSGAADDADSGVDTSTQTTWYTDADSDGYGDTADSGTLYCDEPSGVVTDNTDCDDGNIDINPGATEVCDAADTDEDCNGVADDADSGVDSSTQSTWYTDSDGDGYGDLSDAGALYCDEPSGVSSDNTDCDDSASDVYPGATEVCDGVDNDCDSSTSETGTAEFTDTAGTTTDVSASLTGTSTAPASYTLSSDGTLSICEGTWYVQLDVDADVSIEGYDADTTILSAAEVGTVINIEGTGLDVDISGLTVQDGVGDSTDNYYGDDGGGGIQCFDEGGTSLLDVSDAIIRDNDGSIGGGIHTYGCATTVSDSEFIDNTGTFGAAGFVGWPSFELDGVDVNGGVASTSGGAFFIDGNQDAMTFDMEDTLIEDNSASYGGALYVWYDVTATCTGSTSTYAGIVGNTSSGVGGGVYFNAQTSTAFTATDCDFGSSAGGDDNSPNDLEYDSGNEYTAYGDDASFACGTSSCL